MLQIYMDILTSTHTTYVYKLCFSSTEFKTHFDRFLLCVNIALIAHTVNRSWLYYITQKHLLVRVKSHHINC